MTLATMSNNILRYVPGLNPDLVKSIIQTSYDQLGRLEWARLGLTRSLPTVAPYSTGTVSVAANGVVTGLGTTFTAAMVGRQMRVHYDDSYFNISAYTSGVSITLEDWTGEVVAAGETFSIFQTVYPVNVKFGVVYDVIYQVPLAKKSQTYFDTLDPARTSTSSSPMWWAYAGQTSAGLVQVEVYPVPSAVISLRVNGKLKISTLADTDVPYLPENLIESHAMIDCYRMKELQQPKQGWGERMSAQVVIYQQLFSAFEDEDAQLDSHPDRVKDVMGTVPYPVDDNFWVSHDVE
jgi:hypothetical protein